MPRSSIVNETEFRIDCMKREEIFVPEDLKKYYALSPENRRSMCQGPT